MANILTIDIIQNRCIYCDSVNLQYEGAFLSPYFGFKTLGITPRVISKGEFTDLSPGTSYVPCFSVFCDRCEGMFLNIRFTPKALQEFYQDYLEPSYHSARASIENSYHIRMAGLDKTGKLKTRYQGGALPHMKQIEEMIYSRVGKPVSEIRILDFGGGGGENSPFFGRALTTIVDPKLPNPEFLNHYDVIYSNSTLEHVSFPRIYLGRLAELASPSTLIYIEVPLENFMTKVATNTATWRTKRVWTEHVNFFSRKAFLKCLVDANLSIEEHFKLDMPTLFDYETLVHIAAVCRVN